MAAGWLAHPDLDSNLTPASGARESWFCRVRTALARNQPRRRQMAPASSAARGNATAIHAHRVDPETDVATAVMPTGTGRDRDDAGQPP